MKADLKRRPKVSLLFYSEEEGKRTLVDKWTIEVGKKYTIGRSKKKVDISIQDITISRIHSEFIFYDKDKIMIKDFNSSNGTYINKQRIEPNKENYFSVRDMLSIGDEKKELIFIILNDEEEEETNIRNDFDNISENKNKNEEIKQNQKNKNQKNYVENERENIKNNKYYKREKSRSLNNDSSSRKNEDEKDKYYENEDEDKNNKYRNNKFGYNRNKNSGDKYEDSNYKNNKYRYKSRSRSRSRRGSRKKQYNKRDTGYRRNKKLYTKYSPKSNSDSEKSSKKNKHKNILSFIIKQEEEIEKENDKKQIRLYNEYLKIKEETDAKMEMKNLPNLLPVLTAKFDEDDDIYPSEDSSENGSYGKKDVIKLPYHLKRKLRTGIIRNFKLSERKNDYRQNKNINRNYQSNRYNKKIKRRDD
jgi:pSer/pThr/pTyr-binding forkhead associated (FHA) protein